MKKAAGDTDCMKTTTGKVRWYDAKQRRGMGMLPGDVFTVKYLLSAHGWVT